MPLYRPQTPSNDLLQATRVVSMPQPPVQSETATPPIAEMVKAGVRCESDLVIEPRQLQDSTTGQQFSLTTRVATVDGVKEFDSILADAGTGTLGVVVQSNRDRQLASVATQTVRSESSVTVTATEEGTSTTPAKDPGVSQYQDDYQLTPEQIDALNAQIRARNQANFEATLSSTSSNFQVSTGTGITAPSLPSEPVASDPTLFYPGSHIPLPPELGGNVVDPIYGELQGSLGF